MSGCPIIQRGRIRESNTMISPHYQHLHSTLAQNFWEAKFAKNRSANHWAGKTSTVFSAIVGLVCRRLAAFTWRERDPDPDVVTATR